LYKNTVDACTASDYDALIVSYASFYANYNGICRVIDRNAKAKLYWLTNEYNLQINGSVYKKLRERNYEIIANHLADGNTMRAWSKFHTLNLNALFYEPTANNVKKYGICYFGTYRCGRDRYFRKFFTDKRLFLSSSDKNFKKFMSVGCKFQPCRKFVWGKQNTLGAFKYSLYLEDEFTNKNYSHLADRFYEALSSETVTLFDSSIKHTLENSEIKDCDYEQFFIESLDDVEKFDYKRAWLIQKEWIPLVLAERQKCLEGFEAILLNG
jgi:hypothetical protein